MKEGWAECTLGEICDFIGGGTPSKSQSSYWNGKIPWASIKDIKGDTLLNTQDFITEEGLKNSSANRVSKNEIILATRINPGRPILSKIEASINQDLKVVKTKIDIDISFLFWMFKTLENEVIKLSSGTTVLGINLTNLKSITICFPSLPEQRAIVAKIEELFSSLDSGIADLKKAQEQLKIYRQAVLKKAFEGSLTKGWRAKQTNLPTADELLKQIKEERKSHYRQQVEDWKKAVLDWEANAMEGKKPSRPTKDKELVNLTAAEIKSEISIPTNWFYKKIGNITDTIVPNRDKPKSFNGDIQWVTTPDLSLNSLRINYRNIEKGLSKEECKKYNARIIPVNSVIMTCVGMLGTSSIVEKEIVINQQLHAFLPSKTYAPKYLGYLIRFNTPYLERSSTATTVKYLNKTKCNSLPFPVCSILEQQQIVLEIESRLSVCDKLEESIVESLEKAKALRQSILKKAFEGRLLNDQELAACKSAADYEPASVLLKRIKAEKASKK